MIVMKFGGTSVGDAERMLAIARPIAERSHATPPIVVTSAMSGVTNELVRLIDVALGGDRAALDRGFEQLSARHLDALAAIAPADDALAERLRGKLRELRILLRGVRLVGTTTARAQDALLGFGEQLAQDLLEAALVRRGLGARAVDAREVVVTDGTHGAARPDVDATRRRAREHVLPLVDDGMVPVLGGYLGATPQGIPTTLGRGGSDLSATVIGLAVEADAIEIWTDVDGLMSADPRLVPSARRLERVSFREAAELADLGAKVLHPASIDPAVRAGIPVVVRNSLAPERAGTEIGSSESVTPGVRAIVARRGCAIATLRAPGRATRAGFASELIAEIEGAGVRARHVTSGPMGLEALVESGDESALSRALEAMRARGPVEVHERLALLSIVGDGVATRLEPVVRALSVLSPDTRLRIVQAPRGSALLLIVAESLADDLVRALHRTLIEEESIP